MSAEPLPRLCCCCRHVGTDVEDGPCGHLFCELCVKRAHDGDCPRCRARQNAELIFQVRGLPAPQGSKRHVGKGIMVESSQNVRPWRESVKAAVAAATDGMALPLLPIGVPAGVRFTFSMKRPKSAPANKQVFPAGPDLDKLVRSTLDGLTEAGVWADDRQVKKFGETDLLCAGDKRFGKPEALDIPGALIFVWRLEPATRPVL